MQSFGTSSMIAPVWHRFEVDGETYYWTTYASERRIGTVPLEPTEHLDVARAPNTPGVGHAYPPGTVVTEQHAIDLVRLVMFELRHFP
jgi:hypothetical protein